MTGKFFSQSVLAFCKKKKKEGAQDARSANAISKNIALLLAAQKKKHLLHKLKNFSALKFIFS